MKFLLYNQLLAVKRMKQNALEFIIELICKKYVLLRSPINLVLYKMKNLTALLGVVYN